MFCNHQWKALSQTVTQSKFESALKALGHLKGKQEVEIPPQMSCAKRKHISILSCEKCGKLKYFVEDI